MGGAVALNSDWTSGAAWFCEQHAPENRLCVGLPRLALGLVDFQRFCVPMSQQMGFSNTAGSQPSAAIYPGDSAYLYASSLAANVICQPSVLNQQPDNGITVLAETSFRGPATPVRHPAHPLAFNPPEAPQPGGQRELQEGARWLARRGVAAWASQRRFDPPLPKGLTGWRAGNEASCGRPGGMSPELCACAGLLAVFRSLSSEAGPQARAGYFQGSRFCAACLG